MEKNNLFELLERNPYPGRGILLGRSADGLSAVAAYFIMGRSENSRNRVFVPTEDGIRTQAHDPSKMTDPSLIIYHPVRQLARLTIVTNGDQTDTIRDALDAGGAFPEALAARTFEPDGPNWTPRISGLLCPFRGKETVGVAAWMSILKSADGNPDCCCRYFYSYDQLPAGEGRFIHTYQGDGNPLPSFEGEPVRVQLDAPDPDTLADRLWTALNQENKVSLFVRYIRLTDGGHQDVIRNKLQ